MSFRFLRPRSTHWYVSWRNSPHWARAASLGRLHDHIQTYNTVGSTLDELSARPRELYSTTHNTQKWETSGWNRACNPSKREAADPSLRPRGHWDRPMACINHVKPFVTIEVHHVAIITNIPENKMARRLQTVRWKYRETGTQFFPWSHYSSTHKYYKLWFFYLE